MMPKTYVPLRPKVVANTPMDSPTKLATASTISPLPAADAYLSPTLSPSSLTNSATASQPYLPSAAAPEVFTNHHALQTCSAQWPA